ncbi:MAG: hypothetical protein M0041_06325 [Nitrospiraceae bacterium]|nr:hypothetical protein [Nitrospiraceae bacterium]
MNKTRERTFPPYLFWTMGGLRLAGADISTKDRLCLAKETERLLNDWTTPSALPSLLADLVAVLSLRRDLDLPLSENEKGILRDLLAREKVLPRPLPLPELRRRIFLMGETGLFRNGTIESELSLEREYRHPVFGYVLVPGSSRSDLFVLESGLLMRRNHLSPYETETLENLILSCQSREGGFGPVGGAVPTLEATCMAFELLFLLFHFSSTTDTKNGNFSAICRAPSHGHREM